MSQSSAEAISGQWRSEDMTLINFVIPRESAYSCVYAVAQVGCVQILDCAAGQAAHLRSQSGVIRQCDELERKFRFFKEQMDKVEVVPDLAPTAHDGNTRDANALRLLEDRVSRVEKELREAAAALDSLQSQLKTMWAQIAACETFESLAGTFSLNQATKTIMGVVPSNAAGQLARLVYRASRGNAIVKSATLGEGSMATYHSIYSTDKTGTKGLTAFLTLTSSDAINKKLKAIASTLGSQLISTDDVEKAGGLIGYKDSLEKMAQQMEQTLQQTEGRHFDIVCQISKTYHEDARAVQIDKTVAVALNLFSYSESFLKGKGWVPTSDLHIMKEAVAHAHLYGQGIAPMIEVSTAKHKLTPPTHFKTSKYMEVFQMIVNSYGTPHYKEINPAVFTIITFPYMFGIMFGDMGHGVLLSLFSAALILFEPVLTKVAKENEMFAMIFTGRYLLFLMGLFAIYIGILYNDFFGFSVGLFESAYQWPQLPPYGPGGVVQPNNPNGLPSVKPSEPYMFGLDVAWAETENKLEFYNSVKMKAAVVVGVVQMSLGIVLSFMNKLYKQSYREIFFLVIPEMIFLTCTFGYMSLLIIVKWCTSWENTNLAPSLLETMTNFFLSPGDVKVELYSGQAGIQMVLLFVAVSMTPVMLLVTPLLERRDHNARQRQKAEEYSAMRNAEGGQANNGDGDDDEHFDFSEVMIHYVIHTIEFVLGCVSNTASYLRLWALSLAHAQLSEVFFNFAFCLTLGMDTGIGAMTVAGTGVWLMATIGVLLGMESLSAFLHSLRLHWVEFQNKFYAADGIPFEPLTLPEE